MVKKIAFLFPGQGSQSIGMGKPYSEWSTKAKSLLEQADQVLGFPISQIMFEGPEEKLKATDITQPALFIASAMALAVTKEKGIDPHWVAGHSLGEYSALYAAGTLNFEDTLRLVHARGKAMQDCANQNPGTMAAVIGLAPEVIVATCQDINKEGDIVVAANFNQSAQTVISGSKAGVAKAMDVLAKKGAAKVVELNVAGAFHSPLMSEAAQKMKPLIESISFKMPQIPVITNVDAQATTDFKDLKSKLIQQIDHPVLWDNTLKTLIQLGTETFVEVGSGKILSSMVRRLDKSKTVLWTDDIESIDKNISLLTLPS